jgi:probable rRNA maturation factor|tara:strand:- start:1209 stop:1676 length:468 start_codon:yes stop_codon:yes gene_type:complete
MIKLNVLIKDKKWDKHIKQPNLYFKRKIKRLNKKVNKFRNTNIECSLLLTSDTDIRALNKKFRNKNKTTDVLSFPFYEKKALKKLLKRNKDFYLGDVIVNINKVKNKYNSKKDFMSRVDKLWIHGLLHLLGYRHKIKKDYDIMQKLEDKFLKIIN